MNVAVWSDPAAASCALFQNRDRLACAPELNGAREGWRVGVVRRLQLIEKYEVERIEKAGETGPASETFVPAQVGRGADASSAQRIDGASPADAITRAKGEMNVGGPDARQHVQQARLELRVDTVEGDKRSLVGRRQRGGDRVRLAATAEIADANALGTKTLGDRRTERAQRTDADAQPGRGDGGDDDAAAHRGNKAIGLDLLAGPGQALEANEDEVVERFAHAQERGRGS